MGAEIGLAVDPPLGHAQSMPAAWRDRNVVRSLVRLGGWTGETQRLALPASVAGLRSVILVQSAEAGPILGVVRVEG